MGNAMGAVGQDFSSISINPAGLGLFRRPTFVFTPSVVTTYTTTDFNGSSAFDSKAKGLIDGYRILDSELQGSTGIGEVSITFLPSRDSGTRVRASLQGFVGTREGYIGQIQWTETF